MTVTVRFAGYAAIFDHPDRGGDIIRKGAFDGAKAGLPVFWCHDATCRIGTVDTLLEDDRGLRVTGTITGRAVPIGQGLSFGYRVRAAGKTGPFRELNALDLIEVSLVAQPMQPLARIIATRALGRAHGRPGACRLYRRLYPSRHRC
jgi:HK97 family phage prohead protease